MQSQEQCHQRQGPFCGACKTYTKPSTFDKYVIKFVGTANPIPNFEFVGEYVKDNKQIKCFKFILGAYQTPHLEFVSHTRFKFDEIAKPSKYLYYLEQYASTAYLSTYLDFLVFTHTDSMAVNDSVNAKKSKSPTTSSVLSIIS